MTNDTKLAHQMAERKRKEEIRLARRRDNTKTVIILALSTISLLLGYTVLLLQ